MLACCKQSHVWLDCLTSQKTNNIAYNTYNAIFSYYLKIVCQANSLRLVTFNDAVVIIHYRQVKDQMKGGAVIQFMIYVIRKALCFKNVKKFGLLFEYVGQ